MINFKKVNKLLDVSGVLGTETHSGETFLLINYISRKICWVGKETVKDVGLGIEKGSARISCGLCCEVSF